MSLIPARLTTTSLVLLAACGPAPTPELEEATVPEPLELPPLPAPVANNAVASVATAAGTVAFSFLGLDASKTSGGITSAAYRLEAGADSWSEIEPVPGPPRLAATAQAVSGRVYVFGGYTVASDGAERSVPEVYAYDLRSGEWTRTTSIPVPVDDAVSGVWRDSLIFLVSGWHDTDNESHVQIYDPANDEWRQGTPIPGPPVFGHTGGIVGNSLVYVDGVRVDTDPRRFTLERSSWLGRIDPLDPTTIAWERIADHPGPPVYRGAAVGVHGRIVFAGGSDNPYNYNGVGYDGRPSEPTGTAFAWDSATESWTMLEAPAIATMDHRGLVRVGGRLYTIGGMTAGQRVTAAVVPLPDP
jgi:N-acetylneuraminic acid mutarotase